LIMQLDNMKKTSIYISYFAESKIIKSKILTPIQVGASLSTKSLDMLQDNIGENISQKNPHYCELTAIYWAWKNDKTSDYLGFFQ